MNSSEIIFNWNFYVENNNEKIERTFVSLVAIIQKKNDILLGKNH